MVTVLIFCSTLTPSVLLSNSLVSLRARVPMTSLVRLTARCLSAARFSLSISVPPTDSFGLESSGETSSFSLDRSGDTSSFGLERSGVRSSFGSDRSGGRSSSGLDSSAWSPPCSSSWCPWRESPRRCVCNVTLLLNSFE